MHLAKHQNLTCIYRKRFSFWRILSPKVHTVESKTLKLYSSPDRPAFMLRGLLFVCCDREKISNSFLLCFSPFTCVLWTLSDINKDLLIKLDTSKVIQGDRKIWHNILYALISSNINRFSKLFHCQNQEKICNNAITKDPTTPQVCRHTTL